MIHYIKCIMPGKSSKWELGFVHYITKFTMSRFVILRFKCMYLTVKIYNLHFYYEQGVRDTTHFLLQSFSYFRCFFSLLISFELREYISDSSYMVKKIFSIFWAHLIFTFSTIGNMQCWIEFKFDGLQHIKSEGNIDIHQSC